MRKLASIQKISGLFNIDNADNIERAEIMGWSVIVRKNEFKVGDKCVFFEIDSVLPNKEWSKFMERRNFRVKTCKMRGQLSQGLALSIDILGKNKERKWWQKLLRLDGWSVGMDVSEYLGVRKYNSPIEKFGFKIGRRQGNFPSYVPQTDEIRVQSALSLLNNLKGKEFYVTVKLDGTSATYSKLDGKFLVCSRSRSVKDGDNIYWDMARKYDIKSVLPDGFAVQGEIVGPGIQKNHMELKEIDFMVFDIFNIKAGKRLDYYGLRKMVESMELNMVPEELVVVNPVAATFNHNLCNWIERAKGKYENSNHNREGLVVRSLDRKISFKVLNNDFLLKEE